MTRITLVVGRAGHQWVPQQQDRDHIHLRAVSNELAQEGEGLKMRCLIEFRSNRYLSLETHINYAPSVDSAAAGPSCPHPKLLLCTSCRF